MAGHSEGCWTCRVRRKKCDTARPACRVCSALLITCHFGHEKPAWMDGGDGQRDMVEQLKREVKDKAAIRHSLSYAQGIDDGVMMDVEVAAGGMAISGEEEAKMEDAPAGPTVGRTDGFSKLLCTSSQSADRDNRNNSNLPALLTTAFPSSPKVLQSEPEMQGMGRAFILFYLDYYFPFLFPFYNPPMLQCGRAWVLDFMVESPALQETNLCLSAYFFSLALETADSGHAMCKSVAWAKLLGQLEVTFARLQQELRDITAMAATPPSSSRTTTTTTAADLSKVVQVMGSILQLQRFETAIWSFENCAAHLAAAVVLFRQLLESEAFVAAPSSPPARRFRALLGHMAREFSIASLQAFQVPTSLEMAFRFFAALVLVDDVIASTALAEEPRLLEYHDSLLGDGGGGETAQQQQQPLISIEAVLGVQNWVVLGIGRIAALDAWKKRRQAAGDLDVMELAARASAIRSDMLSRLSRAEVAAATQHSSGGSSDQRSVLDVFTTWRDQQPVTPANQGALVTRVWAHAALIYLCVVVSGWQPANAEVRHHVGRVVDLLAYQMPVKALLRAAAWPFCVAGCLAEPGRQEETLRLLVGQLEPPGLFGTVRKAFGIMEEMWKRRGEVDPLTWDLAACFRSPGHLVLLV